MTQEIKKAAEQLMMYKQMNSFIPGSSILREVAWQYRDMAKGGDGGELGFEENGHTTCRGVNYPGHSDAFFQFVCAGMGWKWKSDE